MFGCLKFIFKTIIIILAIVGFVSIGGVDFVKKFMSAPPTQVELKEKAKDIADLSDIDDEYEITKTTGVMGYNVLLVEHKESGQKLAIFETNKKEMLTEDDFKNGGIEEKLNEINNKLKRQFIHVNNLKVTSSGTMSVGSRKVPYVQFQADVQNLPFDKVKGLVGAYKNKDDKNKIFASANVADKYSQKIASDFFKKVK